MVVLRIPKPPLSSVQLWLGLVICALVLAGCQRRAPATRAFYYWRTTFTLSPVERAALDRHRVQRLYLRLFDVVWDKTAATPVGRIEFNQPVPANLDVVPVVYLANSVFEKEPKAEDLAGRVWSLATGMADNGGFRFRQMQVDCDWSDRTREAFFAFCRTLRQLAHGARVGLSATIRLHQIKYPQRTGVPPVDRGMLMFYNVGQLTAEPARTTIFNAEDADRYVSFVEDYRLPLDAALAVFSWGIHSRDGEIVGLINKTTAATLDGVPALRREGEQRYRAAAPSLLHGTYLQEGDTVVLETMTPPLTRQSVALLARHFHPRAAWSLALFDLDERNLKNYGPQDLEDIYSGLH
jgi:hypothetical protein